jgi:hypothetical protein
LTIAALAFWAAAAAAQAPSPSPSPAARGLLQRYEELRERLEHSPYGRPLWLDSREGANNIAGDAFAIIPQPFARVAGALGPVDNWCEVLILPFNVKRCEVTRGERPRISVSLGPKGDSPQSLAYALAFDYTIAARTSDYLELALKARDGPLGTHDHRILMQAVPLDEGRTFVHVGYSYGFGMFARAAMQAYLTTVSASKVGFTREGQGYVGGMRGALERNTMRYYLAIDAYLGSLDVEPVARVAKRLNDWYSGIERYPRQLSESIGRPQYLAMKTRVD